MSACETKDEYWIQSNVYQMLFLSVDCSCLVGWIIMINAISAKTVESVPAKQIIKINEDGM